jgi:putative oxidoreductase
MLSIFEASPWNRRLLSILRIVAGLLFMLAGTSKLFGFPPSETPMSTPPGSLMWFAGVLETFGGLAVLLGLLTRPVAFLLSGEMAVAYFMVHAPRSPFPTVNEGVPAVLFSFLFLYLAFAGGGQWSVDAMLARKREQRPPRDAPSGFASAR